MAEPVCKVVDGDTFHLCNGIKVRLSGIDAPEHGEPFYWESRRTLAELLQGGKGLSLKDCHTDTTGKRQACDVLIEGHDIQAVMVKQGRAWDWPRFSRCRYAEQEREASANHIGLWANQELNIEHWRLRKR